MPIRGYNPTSPGRRNASGRTFDRVTKEEPEKRLLATKKRTDGRSKGRITVRHRGGGHKRRIRVVDFKRDKAGVPGRVAAIEYDPNRSADIALISYRDGDWRYIIAAEGLAVDDVVVADRQAPIQVGNAMPLRAMPLGTEVHCVELQPGRGAQMGRSAGAAIRLMARENGYALLRLPSGEMRQVREECMATVGIVGNSEHAQVKLGKAGRRRHLGRRPQVRGAAMNPVDHPHGGGEGKAPVGMPGPKSPWGKPTLGYRTRRNKRTDQFIVRRRGKGRR